MECKFNINDTLPVMQHQIIQLNFTLRYFYTQMIYDFMRLQRGGPLRKRERQTVKTTKSSQSTAAKEKKKKTLQTSQK